MKPHELRELELLGWSGYFLLKQPFKALFICFYEKMITHGILFLLLNCKDNGYEFFFINRQLFAIGRKELLDVLVISTSLGAIYDLFCAHISLD